MCVLIGTALFKPAKDSWGSTDELQREARDVRTAFGALDRLDEAQRLDSSQIKLDEVAVRLLRLEVELAGGKFQEAAQRAGGWLANGGGATARVQMTAEQRDRMRGLAAEAQLALGKPDLAAQFLTDLLTPGADPRVVDLGTRVARAGFASDAAGAVALFDRVLHATSPDDPAFRVRLIDWMQYRVKHDPNLRVQTVQEGERYAMLFATQDCPSELREAFDQLRKAQ